MSRALVAEFTSEADFVKALDAAREQQRPIADAYAPYLPEAEKKRPDPGPMRVTLALTAGGAFAAVAFYLLEWWSATQAYAFDSGSRPPNSWPAFMLAPFEFGVFAAGFAGFVALLFQARLPRLHDPIFGARGFERASQDRYFLVLGEPGGETERFVRGLGAVATEEIEL